MKICTPVRSLKFLFGFFFILGLGISAQAQLISWGSANPITGDSNLISSGTEQDAFLTNSGDSSAITLPDGLEFHPAKTPPSTEFSATDGLGLSWQITGGDSRRYSWSKYSQPQASSAFDTLMESGGVYSDGGSATGTVTISNLQAGHSYTVQVFEWAADGDPGLITLSGEKSVTLNDGGSISSSGEFATGTFIATGSTETFGWFGDGSSYTPLGPISVEDFGDMDAPEPSTYALMLCGITLLFTSRWSRRSKLSPRLLNTLS